MMHGQAKVQVATSQGQSKENSSHIAGQSSIIKQQLANEKK